MSRLQCLPGVFLLFSLPPLPPQVSRDLIFNVFDFLCHYRSTHRHEDNHDQTPVDGLSNPLCCCCCCCCVNIYIYIYEYEYIYKSLSYQEQNIFARSDAERYYTLARKSLSGSNNNNNNNQCSFMRRLFIAGMHCCTLHILIPICIMPPPRRRLSAFVFASPLLVFFAPKFCIFQFAFGCSRLGVCVLYV